MAGNERLSISRMHLRFKVFKIYSVRQIKPLIRWVVDNKVLNVINLLKGSLNERVIEIFK